MKKQEMIGGKKGIIGLKKKGGVRLSTSLVAIATVLRATGEDMFETVVVDSDGFNRSMTELMGERDDKGKLKPPQEQSRQRGVVQANLFEADGGIALFEAAESAAEIVIVDTPAGGLDKVDDLSVNLRAADLVEQFKSQGRDLAVIVPFGPHPETIRGVRAAIDLFGPDVTYIGARDMVGVTDRDYRLWTRDDFTDRYGALVSGATRRLFEEVGGIQIDIPALNAGTLSLMKALRLDFSAAATAEGLSNWAAWDSANIRNWLKAWFPVLDRLRPFLKLDEQVQWKGWQS